MCIWFQLNTLCSTRHQSPFPWETRPASHIDYPRCQRMVCWTRDASLSMLPHVNPAHQGRVHRWYPHIVPLHSHHTRLVLGRQSHHRCLYHYTCPSKALSCRTIYSHPWRRKRNHPTTRHHLCQPYQSPAYNLTPRIPTITGTSIAITSTITPLLNSTTPYTTTKGASATANCATSKGGHNTISPTTHSHHPEKNYYDPITHST